MNSNISHPRILTNMTFWQSPEWMAHTDSIYPGHGQFADKPMSPFREALTLFQRRGSYQVIHSMGVRESMFYGLLCMLFGKESRQVMTEIFLDETQSGMGWKLKTSVQRMVARRSLGIITNSAAEIPALSNRLQLSPDHFCFVPLNSTVEPVERPVKGDGYILAAGRSLRDYPLLIQAARRIEYPIIIIGGTNDLDSVQLPGNVSLLREVSYEEYLDYVRRCECMVLPLQETMRPTGQVVMLEAMSFGKPVIATEHVGTIDYINHEVNGLLIPAGDAEALIHAIETLMRNPDVRTLTGSAALQTIREKHTETIHTQLRLEAIRSFCAEQPDNQSTPPSAQCSRRPH